MKSTVHAYPLVLRRAWGRSTLHFEPYIFKMADELKVGFIGGGNMAKAIANGFITSKTVKPGNITASAITEKTLAVWKVM